MKTKFEVILVGLKQNIQFCEKELKKIEIQITQAQQEIQDLIYKMEHTQIPTQGDIFLIKELFDSKKAFLSLIDKAQERLSALKYKKAQKANEYRYHQLEFEKMQYLHQKELQNKLKKQKIKQAKQLDEIASIRYYQQQIGGNL